MHGINKPDRYSTLVSKRNERGSMTRTKRKRRGSKKTPSERASLYWSYPMMPKVFEYMAKDRKKVRKTGSLKNPYNSGRLFR